MLTPAAIEALFAREGSSLYGGEAISQAEHALQCAWAAEQQGDDDALVVACLLHDLGHLLSAQRDDALASGIDDLHQHMVLPFLRPWLPADVVEPIGLHVEAKRYLCAIEPEYEDALSDASRHSLALQGGAMTPRAAAAFRSHQQAERAIRLRRHDDAAKVVGLATPPITHFLPRVAALLRVRA
ncbi:phosphonate degradation HD-domain oxygenase [Rhizobacter sp. OV335]|uniref:phosphonate degradation HD-domain oxygenase n=1 Tax=Rhizobacter sp. OV335 TaxID=1500264 RepID=UPI00090F451A|nr:phosphonate degradation HD-domain oxygenase [Rhizobacter sp. OV335]SHN20764.1 phosphonate degradation operons associated HDIG domain protein [Rhizobacter sp. OV335]